MSKSSKKAEVLESATSSTSVATVEAKSIQAIPKDRQQLLASEQQLLAECEEDIAKSQQGFFVVGHRLLEIRDKKLYRGTHDTFASYCNEKWDFSKTHANRLVKAYLCEKHLKSLDRDDLYVPTMESQVRFISDLKSEQWEEIAMQVAEEVGDKEATAEDFAKARQALYPKPERETKPKVAKHAEPSPGETVQPTALGFGTKLVPFTELHKAAVDAYKLFGNAKKHNELEELLWKLKEGLKEVVAAQQMQSKLQETA